MLRKKHENAESNADIEGTHPTLYGFRLVYVFDNANGWLSSWKPTGFSDDRAVHNPDGPSYRAFEPRNAVLPKQLVAQ